MRRFDLRLLASASALGSLFLAAGGGGALAQDGVPAFDSGKEAVGLATPDSAWTTVAAWDSEGMFGTPPWAPAGQYRSGWNGSAADGVQEIEDHPDSHGDGDFEDGDHADDGHEDAAGDDHGDDHEDGHHGDAGFDDHGLDD